MQEFTSYTDAISLKSALEDLLGQDEWYRLKDTRSVKAWRNSMLRALKMTEAALEHTVKIADDHWRTDAAVIIDDGREDVMNAASIVDVFSAFGACYMRLSFHQIGLMPSRKGRPLRVRAVPSTWDLSSYRSVQYVQSETQKLRWEYSRDPRPIEDKALDEKYRELGRR